MFDFEKLKEAIGNLRGNDDRSERSADVWDSYAAVNDPASGKTVSNEGHA